MIGQNPAIGAVMVYHLFEEVDEDTEIKLEILNQDKQVIRTITNKSRKSAKTFGGSYKPAKLPAKKGMNRFIWNFRVDDISLVPDISFYGGYSGYRVGPGEYFARLSIGDVAMTRPFKVQRDPRVEVRNRDSKAHQKLMADLYGQINDLHSSIVKARSIRSQIQKMNSRLKDKSDMNELVAAGETAVEAIDQWEGNVIQTKMETFQDVVNFLNRLNAHMLNLLGTIDGSNPPLTQGQRERYADLSEEWQSYKKKLDQIMDHEVGKYNQLYKEKGLPAVIIPE